MHIEPGLVTGAKLLLGYGTAAGAAGYTVKLSVDSIREKNHLARVSLIITTGWYSFFFIARLSRWRVGGSFHPRLDTP
jgi:hypothetical protein